MDLNLELGLLPADVWLDIWQLLPLPARLNISHVTGAWRILSIESPSLWNLYTYNTDPGAPTWQQSCALLEVLLQRSKVAPFSLTLIMHDPNRPLPEDLRELIRQSAVRFAHICVHVPFDWMSGQLSRLGPFMCLNDLTVVRDKMDNRNREVPDHLRAITSIRLGGPESLFLESGCEFPPDTAISPSLFSNVRVLRGIIIDDPLALTKIFACMRSMSVLDLQLHGLRPLPDVVRALFNRLERLRLVAVNVLPADILPKDTKMIAHMEIIFVHPFSATFPSYTFERFADLVPVSAGKGTLYAGKLEAQPYKSILHQRARPPGVPNDGLRYFPPRPLPIDGGALYLTSFDGTRSRVIGFAVPERAMFHRRTAIDAFAENALQVEFLRSWWLPHVYSVAVPWAEIGHRMINSMHPAIRATVVRLDIVSVSKLSDDSRDYWEYLPRLPSLQRLTLSSVDNSYHQSGWVEMPEASSILALIASVNRPYTSGEPDLERNYPPHTSEKLQYVSLSGIVRGNWSTAEIDMLYRLARVVHIQD